MKAKRSADGVTSRFVLVVILPLCAWMACRVLTGRLDWLTHHRDHPVRLLVVEIGQAGHRCA